VTSPGKSMVAGASKGRGIGRGNFYRQNNKRFAALASQNGGKQLI